MSGKITAIERAAAGSPLTVYVDGKATLEVSEDIVERLGLAVGMDLSAVARGAETEIDEPAPAPGDRAPDPEELERSREASLRLLAVRARSMRELRDRLARKGFDRAVVSETLRGLEAAGLLDDREFARLWCEERVRLRPVGPLRLRKELISKGLSGALVDEALRETYGEHDEVELALRALRRRARPGTVSEKEKARLHSFLLRRGFKYEAISQALRQLKAEIEDGDADI